jgi:hypothetical protein
VAASERILVTAAPCELRATDGVVDVFAALERQFFWADTVIVTPDGLELETDDEILDGEVVS